MPIARIIIALIIAGVAKDYFELSRDARVHKASARYRKSVKIWTARLMEQANDERVLAADAYEGTGIYKNASSDERGEARYRHMAKLAEINDAIIGLMHEAL